MTLWGLRLSSPTSIKFLASPRVGRSETTPLNVQADGVCESTIFGVRASSAAATNITATHFRHVSCPALCPGTASGLLRRPAPAKLLLCLRHRSGSGSPVPVPPEKQLLVLGAAPTRFRVPETERAETGETYVPQ